MAARIRIHIRSNVIGYVALFFSLSLGTAWAVKTNSVKSRHIANGQVKAVDTNRSQVQARVGGTCLPGQSIRLIAEDGSVTCEVDDVGGGGGGGGPPTGPAGGDLTQNYPDPQVTVDAIASAEVIDNTLTAADLAASSVTSSEIANNNVNAAKLGEIVTRSSNYVVTPNNLGNFDASCAAGEELIGGGGGFEDVGVGNEVRVVSSQRVGVTQTWRVRARHSYPINHNLQVDAICLL